MSKIAFIGPKSYFRTMRLIGFDCRKAENEKEALEIIEKLKNDGYGLIFTTEDLISSGGLGVVVLPGLKKGKERVALKKQVEKALGGAVSASFLDSD